MARLDWQKASQRNLVDLQRQQDRDSRSHSRDVRLAREAQQRAGIIDFGKHKGRNLKDIPTGYLLWLTANVKPNRWNSFTLDKAKQIIQQRTAHKVGGPVR